MAVALRRVLSLRGQVGEHLILTTQDEVLEFCERSDRILRIFLGSTPYESAWRFGPFFILLAIWVVVAAIRALISR